MDKTIIVFVFLLVILIAIPLAILSSQSRIKTIKDHHPDAVEIKTCWGPAGPYKWYEGGKNVAFYKVTLQNGSIIYARFYALGYDERPE